MCRKMTHVEAASRLYEKGIRPSPQRIAVWEYVRSNPIHPTADQVYCALSPDMPSLSKTTVYNSLKQLVEAGFLATVNIENDELRYDGNTERHYHFKCLKCGKIFDIPARNGFLIPDMPEDFTVQEIQTNIWGICCVCNKPYGSEQK